MSSLAVFWPCVLGVKDTVRSKPAEPAGGNVPEAGHTVNSLAPPGANAAVNGSALLETASQVEHTKITHVETFQLKAASGETRPHAPTWWCW